MERRCNSVWPAPGVGARARERAGKVEGRRTEDLLPFPHRRRGIRYRVENCKEPGLGHGLAKAGAPKRGLLILSEHTAGQGRGKNHKGGGTRADLVLMKTQGRSTPKEGYSLKGYLGLIGTFRQKTAKWEHKWFDTQNYNWAKKERTNEIALRHAGPTCTCTSHTIKEEIKEGLGERGREPRHPRAGWRKVVIAACAPSRENCREKKQGGVKCKGPNGGGDLQ